MFLFVHRFGRGPKYQGKLAKMRYKDAKQGRRAQRTAANRAKWAAMSTRQRTIAVGATGVIVLVFAVIAATGGSHSPTSYSLCEQIMAQKIAAGSTPLAGGAPDACNGLPAARMAQALAAAKAAAP